MSDIVKNHERNPTAKKYPGPEKLLLVSDGVKDRKKKMAQQQVLKEIVAKFAAAEIGEMSF